MTDSVKDSAVSAYQELTQNSENEFCGLAFLWTSILQSRINLDSMLPLSGLEAISFYYTEFCHSTIVHGFMAPPTEILKLCKRV